MKLIRNGHQDYEYLRLAGLDGHELEAQGDRVEAVPLDL